MECKIEKLLTYVLQTLVLFVVYLIGLIPAMIKGVQPGPEPHIYIHTYCLLWTVYVSGSQPFWL